MQTYAEKNAGFITQSKLKIFLNNPEEYKLQYIDGIEKEAEEGRHFVIGTAIHDLLGFGLDVFSKKYFLQEKRMLKQDFIDELDALGFSTKGTVAELEERFFEAKGNPIKLTAGESEMILGMFKEVYRQPLADVAGAYEKEKQIEVPFEGLILRGTLDRIDVKNKVIRDWKTTASISKLLKEMTWGENPYLFQVSFYWLLAKIKYGIECDVILDIVDKSKNTCYYGLKFTNEQIKEQLPIIENAIDGLISENAKLKAGEECFKGVDADLREKTFESDYYNIMECSIQQDFEYIETNQK